MHPVIAVAQAQDPHAAQETLDIGELIIGHISNSPVQHPLIHLPTVWGIDLSVTKHVLMLWIVAVILALFVITIVRRYIAQTRLVPAGAMGTLEIGVEFIRDGVIAPSVGTKWANAYT